LRGSLGVSEWTRITSQAASEPRKLTPPFGYRSSTARTGA
jgi:hypothetical protein